MVFFFFNTVRIYLKVQHWRCFVLRWTFNSLHKSKLLSVIWADYSCLKTLPLQYRCSPAGPWRPEFSAPFNLEYNPAVIKHCQGPPSPDPPSSIRTGVNPAGSGTQRASH